MSTLTKENLTEMSAEELYALKTKTEESITRNEQNYSTKYDSGNFSDYGASISDNYNGEGAEYTKLLSLSNKIDDELRKRNTTLLSVKETVKKQGSDFEKWDLGYNAEMAKSACPKCGAPIVCVHTDMGNSEYCDVYNHICQNILCDFLIKKDIPGLTMGYRDENGPDPCPFCKRKI